MTESTAEKVWDNIRRDSKPKIIGGVIKTAISLGLSPEEAGELFSQLPDSEANSIAYLFSGVGDGETVRETGIQLLGSSE